MESELKGKMKETKCYRDGTSAVFEKKNKEIQKYKKV